MNSSSSYNTPIRCTLSRWAIALLCVISMVSRAPSARATPDGPAFNAVFGQVAIDWAEQISAGLSKAIESQLRASLAGGASQTRFANATTHALATLSDEGYCHAVIGPRDFSLSGESLSCILTITPGPRSFVHACEFSGTNHTDTSWLRKAAALTSGVPLARAWLSESRTRLERLPNVAVDGWPELTPSDAGEPGQEDVTVRWRLRETRSVRADGLMAAGGAGAGQGLTGQASLRFEGLFGRARSLSVSYRHLRAEQTDLRLLASESFAFGWPLDWNVELNERNSEDHCQNAAANLRYGVGSTNWSLEWGGRWQKTTPGASAASPSRAVEASLGLARVGDRSDETGPAGETSLGRLTVLYSRRHQFAGPASDAVQGVSHRLRVDATIDRSWALASSLSCRLSIEGRWWETGNDRIGPGDEWYLGDADHMRGYPEQSLVASSGVWGSAGLRQRIGASMAFSVFAEGARLSPFPDASARQSALAPYGYGCTLWLFSPERVGRLDIAWRDHVSFQDGIVRLNVSQSW